MRSFVQSVESFVVKYVWGTLILYAFITFVRMNFFRKSIVRKLMVLFFIVGITSLSLIGIYSYYKAKRAILQRTLDQMTSIRVMKKSQAEFFFNERMKSLDLISRSGSIRDALIQLKGIDHPPWPTTILLDKRKIPIDTLIFSFGSLYSISETPEGAIACYELTDSCWVLSQNGMVDKRLLMLSDKVMKSHREGIVDLSSRYPGDTLPVCFIGAPVSAESGGKIGVLAMEVSIREIDNIMLEKSNENGLGESGEAYLVGEDLLMRSNSRFIPNSVLLVPVNTTSVRNAFSNQTGSAIIDDYRTIPCLSSYSKLDVPGLNWVILAEIDYKEAMIPILSIRNDLLLITLIVSVFIFSVAQILSLMISQPIIRLKNAALQIGQGKFDVEVGIRGDDEISLLSKTFNDMTSQLEQERNSRMTALYDGQELERQRISRELHDGIGQLLVSLKIRFENYITQYKDENIADISELRADFARTLDEVRRVSYNLAPAGIREFGLDGSLGLFCKEIREGTGLEVDFASFGKYDGMSLKARNYLFRITQEAVSNIIRHGNASRIDINLNEGAENYILMIEDNGCGFQHSQIKSGTGLFNIRERTRLLGGIFTIESTVGNGTTLRIKIPKMMLSESYL
ncbi:MAG: HAMP domain-containing protein [Bacteroidales bacterium]|nr:HAMP domain-containing protein [Bacteroidales bacterium]